MDNWKYTVCIPPFRTPNISLFVAVTMMASPSSPSCIASASATLMMCRPLATVVVIRLSVISVLNHCARFVVLRPGGPIRISCRAVHCAAIYIMDQIFSSEHIQIETFPVLGPNVFISDRAETVGLLTTFRKLHQCFTLKGLTYCFIQCGRDDSQH